MSTGDLKATWDSFFGAKPQSVIGTKFKTAVPRAKTKERDPKMTLGICYAWNRGQCLKAAGACSTAKGRMLKHICDHVADPAKPLEVCGKEHACRDFHK